MATSSLAWRLVGPLVLSPWLMLAPASALALTITAASVNQSVYAELGSGPFGEDSCKGTFPGCSGTRTQTDPVPLVLPLDQLITIGFSTTVGARGVDASATAELSVNEPLKEDYPDEYFRGLVWIAYMASRARIIDSHPDEFKTWASAASSTDNFLQFGVPADLAGQRIYMEIFRNVSWSELATKYEVSFWIEDATTGAPLLDLIENWNYPRPMTLDLTHLAGHEIRISMRSQFEIFGSEGFGGDSISPFRPYFSSGASGLFLIYRVDVPEPTFGWLLPAVIAAVATQRRRSRSAAISGSA
jgi:hypothetical protein